MTKSNMGTLINNDKPFVFKLLQEETLVKIEVSYSWNFRTIVSLYHDEEKLSIGIQQNIFLLKFCIICYNVLVQLTNSCF